MGLKTTTKQFLRRQLKEGDTVKHVRKRSVRLSGYTKEVLQKGRKGVPGR